MISSHPPWGKTDGVGGPQHHLAHHCADVAACFEAIVAQPVFRSRLSLAGGIPINPTLMARLAVLVFLHDSGKLHPGFQAKGWPDGIWQGAKRGHVQEGAAILLERREPSAIRASLRVNAIRRWLDDDNLVIASLAHHGRPFQVERHGGTQWGSVTTAALSYNPDRAAEEIGRLLPLWFPVAFSGADATIPVAPAFQHLFAGLVALADWLGSDRRFFPFVAELDPAYIDKARARAAEAVATVGLNLETLRPFAAGHADFAGATGFPVANPQQDCLGTFSLDERLVILEAETGSGKTEAAFWRFARLFEAGLVDGLYFALPTRAAAVQLHARIGRMMAHFLGGRAAGVILAVPGYLKVGEVTGQALPHWRVRWDDEGQVAEDVLASRWAAESARRFLAAPVAVGTVDQAMLAGLQVKHAHLRGAALARNLLVIDEVHASDRYMTEVQAHLLDLHLGRGGHAMLMSATLGASARARWIGGRRRKTPSFESAVHDPYPAVWGRSSPTPAHPASTADRHKAVVMSLVPSMAADEVARRAMEAAAAGARVLVIRNTVAAAIAVWTTVRAAGGEQQLLSVAGGPALHHGRFAPEDRRLLDAAVEMALSPHDRRPGGVIVIGSQTLEQSLDIDADVLISDLCPVDVLLQRIGRLHRRAGLMRPPGFDEPACQVLVPEAGLARLVAPAFENGLGAWIDRAGGAPNGIYRDVSVLELTRRLVEDHPVWRIPEMNRLLVESATHDERIDQLHAELGADWTNYRTSIVGGDIAKAGAARILALPANEPFGDLQFPGDEETIRTRLGAEGARIEFNSPVQGPFGEAITALTLPAHWSRGVDWRAPPVVRIDEDALLVEIDKIRLRYDRAGIKKLVE